MQELEDRLRSGHLEEMQAINVAHRSQVNSLKEEAENKLQDDLDKLRVKHGSRIGKYILLIFKDFYFISYWISV